MHGGPLKLTAGVVLLQILVLDPPIRCSGRTLMVSLAVGGGLKVVVEVLTLPLDAGICR